MTYASAAGVKARVHLFAVDIGVIIYRNKEGGDRNGRIAVRKIEKRRKEGH